MGNLVDGVMLEHRTILQISFATRLEYPGWVRKSLDWILYYDIPPPIFKSGSKEITSKRASLSGEPKTQGG